MYIEHRMKINSDTCRDEEYMRAVRTNTLVHRTARLGSITQSFAHPIPCTFPQEIINYGG